jgi:hypothetical protein
MISLRMSQFAGLGVKDKVEWREADFSFDDDRVGPAAAENGRLG